MQGRRVNEGSGDFTNASLESAPVGQDDFAAGFQAAANVSCMECALLWLTLRFHVAANASCDWVRAAAAANMKCIEEWYAELKILDSEHKAVRCSH